MSNPAEAEAEIPYDALGVDSELDFQETEKAFYDAEHHQPERRLSETLMEMAEGFAEKFSEGARDLSHHHVSGWDEDESK